MHLFHLGICDFTLDIGWVLVSVEKLVTTYAVLNTASFTNCIITPTWLYN
jgi:hypothetical protein